MPRTEDGGRMKISNIVRHFNTITEHKLLVMKYCFQVGLYRQGLLHDCLNTVRKNSGPECISIREPEAPMRLNGRLWDFLRHGCIIRDAINTILNIGLMFPKIRKRGWLAMNCLPPICDRDGYGPDCSLQSL